MKTIYFPATNRVHLSRQGLLLDKLREHFNVVVDEVHGGLGDMAGRSLYYVNHCFQSLSYTKPDIVLIRGDRFEMLPIAMLSAYMGITIVHLEGGDLSGVIDNKVRHAITKLADYHFATNKESYARLISMGTDPDRTFNFGSLDVEYAKTIKTTEQDGVWKLDPYALVCFHPTDEENGEAINDEFFGGLKVIRIKSNSDYGNSNGSVEYSAEEYLRKLQGASILVGNSSSFLKEASIFGVPVVNVGTRQANRLTPRNVMTVPHNQDAIKMAVDYQLKHGLYRPDFIYFKENTSANITNVLKNI
jgi:UDP-N-acetylglucosamine 2-epimerase